MSEMNVSPQNAFNRVLGSSAGQALSFRGALNIRSGVFVLGKIALVAAVILCVQIGDLLRANPSDTFPNIEFSDMSNPGQVRTPASLESFSIIQTHRLFTPPQTSTAPTTASKPPSPLRLRLVAINEISGGARLAIIEDTQKQEQDVFDTNDPVFEQGKLVEILSDQIKLEHNGKIETLELTDGAAISTASLPPGTAPPSDQTEFTVPEAELTTALQNLPQLLSQARAVPYFRNGQSIGMRLFAIRSGSLYEKLGLKNGDIVLAVNDNSLSDPAQALKLFEQLKSERSVAVKVERNSQPVDLRYSIR